ncbi:hypothetical protein V1951_10710 [Yersinia sp. 2544 StPb PI]|uniref:hypothetical protein n=1 Tax=Yersinia TaxID=629 RepID=UPI0011809453|nr:hypothetical protein [Yersinia massiliensis]
MSGTSVFTEWGVIICDTIASAGGGTTFSSIITIAGLRPAPPRSSMTSYPPVEVSTSPDTISLGGCAYTDAFHSPDDWIRHPAGISAATVTADGIFCSIAVVGKTACSRDCTFPTAAVLAPEFWLQATSIKDAVSALTRNNADLSNIVDVSRAIASD